MEKANEQQDMSEKMIHAESAAFKRALHSQKVFKLSSATIDAAEWAWFARPSQPEHQSAPERVSVPVELPVITDRLARFIETVRGCERLASEYSGCLDGVEEHGGDDHDDPICAVFHRLYYAMYEGDAALAELRALLASHGKTGKANP